MNERIRQLAQVYLEPERFNSYGESTQEDHYVFYPDELAEFVRVIVDECADFARQHNLEKADRSHLIHRAIKQHFGVEE
jgi:hypothetical protein